MEFSLGSNSINTSSETLIELIKKQDNTGLQNQFDDGSKFEAVIKNQGTTIDEAVLNIRKTVEESKKDSTAASIARQEAKVFAKGGTIEGHYITGAAVQSGNTLAINLTSKDGRSIKAQLAYGKDGCKIITLNDKKTNTTTEVIYDNTGHKLQETVSSLGGTVTTTYNTVNGQDIPVCIANARNGDGFGCTYTYFNSKGQTTRTIRTGSGIGIIITDYEYNQSGKLIATKSVHDASTTKGGTSVTTTVYETNSKGEQAEKVLHTLNSDGSTKVLYKDIETGKDLKTEEADKDGVVTTVTDHTKNPPKTKTLYNANLDSQEGIISVSRTKSGALSHIDCTQKAFDNFVPPEKSAPNSNFIVIANSNYGNKKSFSYDADGNLIKNLSQPTPKEKPFDATGVLKYDTNKDGNIDVNDVVMPDYDINGDGKIDVTDSTEAQRMAQKIQKYASKTKGYEDIGKDASYDINGDGKIDATDATHVQKAAEAIQKYVAQQNNNQGIKPTGILKYDTNKDGKIDVDDVTVSKYDLNGDKKVDILDSVEAKKIAASIQDFAGGKGDANIANDANYDLNGDGKVDVLDVTQAQKVAAAIQKYTVLGIKDDISNYLVGRNTGNISNDVAVRAWDIDGDNMVTINDAHEYQRIAAGMSDNDEAKNLTSEQATKIATNIQRYLAEFGVDISSLSEYEIIKAFDLNGDGKISGNDINDAPKNKVITFHKFEYDDKYVANGQTGVHTGEYSFKVTENMYNKIMRDFESDPLLTKESQNQNATDKDGVTTSYTREKLARVIQYYIHHQGEFDMTRDEALALLDLSKETSHDDGIIDISDATFAQLGYPKYHGEVKPTPDPCPNPDEIKNDRDSIPFDDPDENPNEARDLD